MAVIQACVKVFAARSGTGSQTVTGITDKNGAAFTGKVFLFQSAYAVINTLTQGGAPTGNYQDYRGVDTGAVRSAYAVSDLYSGFNFKAVSGAVSLGDHSILDGWTGSFGTFTIERTAYISAVRSGEFDLQYVTNGRTGDDVLVVVLGGDDFDVAFTTATNGTKTTSTKPQGLLAIPVPGLAGSGSTSAGVGGHNTPWGFATRDGHYGTSNIYVVNQGNNFSAQRTDAYGTAVDGFGTLSASLPTVSAWGDTSFTIAGNTGADVNSVPMALCGTGLRTAAGSFNQPTATGQQTISLGIDARAVFFVGRGEVTGTSVGSPSAQLATGWTDGTRQIGFWSGERTNGNVGPSYGARYLSDDSLLRFGTPDAGSTTFDAVAEFVSVSTRGDLVIDWTSADATAREIVWFAIGIPASATPTPAPPSDPCCCSCDGGGGTTDGGDGSPGSTGPILLPVDQSSWTPWCTGGGVVPSAADATDAESWVS